MNDSFQIKPEPGASPNPHKENGFAIAIVLFLIVVMVLVGNVMYQMIHLDIRSTHKHLKKVKTDYLAESTLNWGIAITKAEVFIPFTHVPTGDTSYLDAGCCTGDTCCTFKKNSAISLYPSVTLSVNDSNWLAVSPTNPSDAITGDPNEKAAFKSWMENDGTVHIKARVTAYGESAEVQIFGTWEY